MPETSTATDAMNKAADQTVQLGNANLGAAGQMTKQAINETSKVAQSAVDRATSAGQSMTETAAETANVAAGVSSKAAEQSHEVLLMGLRTAADVTSRVGDMNFDRGHHILSSAVQAMDVYRDASERSAGQMQALWSSYMTFGRGLQQMQHAWLEMVQQTMGNATRKPQDLLRCKNVVELAEAQRDLYVEAVSRAVESASRMLDIAGRTAQDAVRPLQSLTH